MKLKEYKRIFKDIKFGSSIYNCAVGSYMPDEYAPIIWDGPYAKIVNLISKKTSPIFRSETDFHDEIVYKTKEFKRELWCYRDGYKRAGCVTLWKRIC